MSSQQLLEALNLLIRKYRDVPFDSWGKVYRGGNRFNDYASENHNDPGWWQAHTDVLEIVTDPNGQKWANVAITLYPFGVHSCPPALYAGLAVHEDGRVEGIWEDGSKFEFLQNS